MPEMQARTPHQEQMVPIWAIRWSWPARKWMLNPEPIHLVALQLNIHLDHGQWCVALSRCFSIFCRVMWSAWLILIILTLCKINRHCRFQSWLWLISLMKALAASTRSSLSARLSNWPAEAGSSKAAAAGSGSNLSWDGCRYCEVRWTSDIFTAFSTEWQPFGLQWNVYGGEITSL